ncbi:MAG: hypothetical protein JZD40_05005 [Sulfolobus sp.]|nr:hypothetical protein [Sulfolobus sp.]
MIFKIFSNDAKNEKPTMFLQNNFYGEWIYINNDHLNTLNEILIKAVKKIGIKKYENYYIEINFDDKLKSLMYVKGFVKSEGYPVNQLSFEHALKKNINDYGTANINVIKILRYCDEIYIFFNLDIIIKKFKKPKRGKLVPMLLPPSGLSSSEIPYNVDDLFRKLVERNGNLNCNNISTELFENIAKVDATCRSISTEINKQQLADAFKYFSSKNSEPKLDIKKNSSTGFQILIYLPNFNYKTLIPLVWDKITQFTALC